MNWVRMFVRSVDRLSDLLGWAASALVPIMVLVVAYEVCARYFFISPTIWAFDTSVFLFGYIGLLGGTFVMRRRDHINVDVFYAPRSPRTRAWMDIVSGLIIGFFLILVIIYGWQAAITGIERGVTRSSEWAPPLGHYLMLIPVSAALMLLQATANWIRDLYLAVTGQDLI